MCISQICVEIRTCRRGIKTKKMWPLHFDIKNNNKCKQLDTCLNIFRLRIGMEKKNIALQTLNYTNWNLKIRYHESEDLDRNQSG